MPEWRWSNKPRGRTGHGLGDQKHLGTEVQSLGLSCRTSRGINRMKLAVEMEALT
jgi:hypothetical protein